MEASLNCTDLTVNTNPSTWATHFPRGLRAALSAEGFLSIGLRYEFEPAPRGSGCHYAGTSRAKHSDVSLSLSSLEHTGVIYRNFLSPFVLLLLGPPRAFIFSPAHFRCYFNANLSIYRLKLLSGQADF